MIALEPAAREDFVYAWRLYVDSIRPLAMALGSWSEADERDIVERSFRDAEAALIIDGGERVGWTHVKTTSQAVELWQLFVAEEHRRQGIGGRVLRRLQAHSRELDLPILLAVLRNNPATRLYGREGFVVHAEGDNHLFLWWCPRLR